MAKRGKRRRRRRGIPPVFIALFLIVIDSTWAVLATSYVKATVRYQNGFGTVL